jgi:hypothetical protein
MNSAPIDFIMEICRHKAVTDLTAETGSTNIPAAMTKPGLTTQRGQNLPLIGVTSPSRIRLADGLDWQKSEFARRRGSGVLCALAPTHGYQLPLLLDTEQLGRFRDRRISIDCFDGADPFYR